MYKIKTEQIIDCSLEDAWSFFSNPYNLGKLTPKKLNFQFIGDITTPTYNGQIINYKISPILGIPIGWTTEIKHKVEGETFTDEQRFGPYSFWYHTHNFKEVKGGILMSDEIHYKLPLGFIGKILNKIYVKNELKAIFDYRFKTIEKLFNTK